MFILSDISCHSPNVSLLNVSPNTPPDLKMYQSSQFIIQSEVSLNCEVSHRTLFVWSVYQLHEEDTLLLTRNSSSELRITPRLLPIGVFLVQLNVSMIGTQVSGVSLGYFQIVRSPLVPIIAGGNKVARRRSKTLIFDASMSYDPDEEDPQFSG